MSTLSDLWGQATDAVAKAVDNVKQTGVPALEASLEKWGSDTLKSMSQKSQDTLNKNINAIASQPGAPAGSFGAAWSSVMQSAGLSATGGYILLFAVGAITVGYLMARK